ncbi:hypothetical protein [Mesorhizobium sp. B2-6-5]|uniref:hypothetical protein n=1 Tax=Mesorhizobium sp. B2-6-5 TaxID=2589912 RepID=UPI001FEE7AC5|nr:hypothetical protein [Mesorhizobium sp. B2-6-5]
MQRKSLLIGDNSRIGEEKAMAGGPTVVNSGGGGGTAVAIVLAIIAIVVLLIFTGVINTLAVERTST